MTTTGTATLMVNGYGNGDVDGDGDKDGIGEGLGDKNVDRNGFDDEWQGRRQGLRQRLWRNSKGEALFVRSGHIVIPDIIVRRRCTQHHREARLCGIVPKMPLLASSFLCIVVHTATFVNGNKEGQRQRGQWQYQ